MIIAATKIEKTKKTNQDKYGVPFVLQNDKIKNKLDYYETSAGRWRLGMAAIWLEDEAQLERARTLINEYQSERSLRIRAEYEKLKKEGKLETIIDRMKREPIQFLFYLAVILSIVYFSIKPFIDIGM